MTFLLIPKTGNENAKRTVLKKFVGYVRQDGQSVASGLHYSPLPASVEQIDMKLLDQMQ